jgi:NADPH-dependent ferric siderophore reductase
VSFTLSRRPNELVFRPARLVERTQLTPHYVRLTLAGDALRGFDSPGSDDHIRVFFPDQADSTALTAEELRAYPSRELTPVSWDAAAGTLELEFLLHGDEGVAGRWAGSAELGSTVGVGGPRGSMVLDGEPDSWFLAGDETALPAIRRFVAAMPAGAPGERRGLVLVEVPDADHQPAFEVPTGTELRWVHRGDSPAGSALAAAIDALTAADRPAGAVFAFVAAEHAIVKPARALVLDRWQLDPEHVVVKGYWRRGEAEYHAPH